MVYGRLCRVIYKIIKLSVSRLRNPASVDSKAALHQRLTFRPYDLIQDYPKQSRYT